jgi:hypothetical protein
MLLDAKQRSAVLTIFRRVLLLWLFMFWQGGFMFYGAVVIPIGSSVLGSDLDQAFITRLVASALNLTGLIVLLAWLWDLLAERSTRLKRRWAVWLFLLLLLAALAWLHPHMDAHLDPVAQRLHQRDDFRHLHRWYLRIITVQWLACILFTVWTLQNWRATDRQDAPIHPFVQ